MILWNCSKIPEGYTADSIRIEKSTCTGERTIGFYDPKEKKLVRAELVRTDADIKAFYEKYGIDMWFSLVGRARQGINFILC